MTNIEFFNKFTLKLLAELYDSFPVPRDFELDVLAREVVPDDSTFEPTYDALTAARETVSFLREEGFVNIGEEFMDGNMISNARLTLKGLAILGSVPGSLEGSLIDKIKKALSLGAKEASTEAIKALTQQALTGALAVGTSWLRA